MPAKLQPMGGIAGLSKKSTRAKSQKVEFLQLQMLAVIQTKASGADECPRGAKQPLFASI
jgi:hypothetical protein